VAKVDCEIDLVVFWDVEDVLFVFHVHCNKLIANLRRMLSIVDKAELLSFDVNFQNWVAFKSNTFTFDLFTPSIFIKAFPEENDIG
jgi:hypothetical protein